MSARVLVAGVGNVFLGDDGFGCEVAQRLRHRPLPAGATWADYGIRGLHLAYDLMRPLDLLVVVDALARPVSPGTVFVLEPDLEALPAGDGSPHGMDLPAVFTQVKQLGAALPRVVLVGCVPAVLEERLGLSPPVAAAVEGAVSLVHEVVERELGLRGPANEREARS